MLLLCKEIVTEDLPTPKYSSTNTYLYEEPEVKEEELANVLVEECEKVQEKLNTIPVRKQNNCSEEWSLIQQQVQQEELLSGNSKEVLDQVSKEYLRLKNKCYHQEQYSGEVQEQWKRRKKLNQLRV
jgi:hypothetical protein